MFRRTNEPEPEVYSGTVPLLYVYGKRFHILPVVIETYRASFDSLTGARVGTYTYSDNERLRMHGRSICACEHWASKEPMASVPDIHRLANTNQDCKRKINELGITPVMITYIDFLRPSASEMQEQIDRYRFVKERYAHFGSQGNWSAVRNTANVFYSQPE